MVLVVPQPKGRKGKGPKKQAPTAAPAPSFVRPAPVVPPPPDPPKSVVEDTRLADAASFYVRGEGTGDTDVASGQELRRWPSLEEISGRFGIPVADLRVRSSVDGWEGRRAVFRAELDHARNRGIAERIAEQEMPARLAYLGIHNDTMRGLGKLLTQMVPRDGQPTCLPRDLKTVVDTAVKGAELLAHATGKTRESQGAFSLAVQVAQSQALGVPVASLPPGMQASLQPADPVSQVSAPSAGSLWSILVEARRSAAPPGAPAAPYRDEWDEPSPLPPHLASDRVPE